jgi:hypothetical protein
VVRLMPMKTNSPDNFLSIVVLVDQPVVAAMETQILVVILEELLLMGIKLRSVRDVLQLQVQRMEMAQIPFLNSQLLDVSH